MRRTHLVAGFAALCVGLAPAAAALGAPATSDLTAGPAAVEITFADAGPGVPPHPTGEESPGHPPPPDDEGPEDPPAPPGEESP